MSDAFENYLELAQELDRLQHLDAQLGWNNTCNEWQLARTRHFVQGDRELTNLTHLLASGDFQRKKLRFLLCLIFLLGTRFIDTRKLS